MPRLPALLSLLILMLLGACTIVDNKREDQVLYDLGPLTSPRAGTATAAPTAPAGPRVAALTVGEISAPTWMESSRMVYRLNYDNPQEARTYARARWAMSPSRQLQQRIKARLSQAGIAVLSNSDGAVGMPVLRIDADDFSQVFDSGKQSSGRVLLRASVLQDRKLVSQRSFSASVPAQSADAAGGVQALAAASDAVIADMVVWLNGLNLPR